LPAFIQLAAAAVTLAEMHLKLGRHSGRRSSRIKQQLASLAVHFRAFLLALSSVPPHFSPAPRHAPVHFNQAQTKSFNLSLSVW